MSVTIIVGGALLLALVAFFVIYNGLVTLKNNVAKNWSNIDVLLKQRFDELPKLVAVCQRYMEHEKETLEGVTRARAAAANAGSAEDSPQAQNMISDALKSLFAVVENYPDVKVLLTTGYSKDGVATKPREDFADAASLPLVRKPYSKDWLARRLRELLDAKSS